MEIGCLVISHKKAKVEEIEKVWVGDYKSLAEFLRSDNISELAFILTCNRFEIYAVGEDIECYFKDLSRKFGVEHISEILIGDSCLEHILRVASGLESMMVGEDQILGQVRDFYNICKKLGTIGEILDKVFGKAIKVGRKVRRETNISKGSVSIGSAAVELAEQVLGNLNNKKALLIGAGEMGTLVAKAIASKNVEAVLIANRTYSRAEELAKKIGGIAVKFDKLEEYLKISDVVISATSAPHTVISKDIVEKAMKSREKLLIIDIALPRDVDEGVKEIPGVQLYTIDDLRKISEKNLRKRLNEVSKAEKIILMELQNLKASLKDLKAKRAIAKMYIAAEKYIDDEVAELYSKLVAKYNVDGSVKELLYSFANSLIKKFLHMPTVRLREAARNGRPYVIDVVNYLFGDGDVSACKNEEIEERQYKTNNKGGKVKQ